MIDLTPLEVRKKKGDFRRGMRGYEPQAVDDFLDLVADRLEQLVRENAAMTERLARVEDQVNDYRERERALTEALVTAQEMREEMRKQIDREVELKRREAQAEAENIRNDALQMREREEESLRTLRARQSQFLQSYRSFLERELTEIAVMAESIDMARGAQPAHTRRPRRRAEPELPPIDEHPTSRAVESEPPRASQPVPVPMPLPVAVPEQDELPLVADEPEPVEFAALEPEPVAEPAADPFVEDGPFIPESPPVAARVDSPEPVAASAERAEKTFDEMLNDLPPFAGTAKVRQGDALEVPVEMPQADEEAEVLADVREKFDSVAAAETTPAQPPAPTPMADDTLELVDDVADDEDEDGWMSTLLEGKGDGQ